MLQCDDARVHDRELVVEQRCRKSLPPDMAVQCFHRLEIHLIECKRAIAFHALLELIRCQPLARHLLERSGKCREIFCSDGKPCRHRVPAESAHQRWRALRHQIQRIAQMEARNRATGALELSLVTRRKHDRRPVMCLAQATGHNTHDTLMPRRIGHHDGLLPGLDGCGDQLVGLRTHSGFNPLALAVESIQFGCDFCRPRRIVRGQTFDPQGNIVETARCVHAGPKHEAEIVRGGFADVAAGHSKQRHHAGIRLTVAHAA